MEYLAKQKAEVFLAALEDGAFPMAEGRFAPDLHLIKPRTRTLLPLAPFHCPRRLARLVRQDPFTIRINHSFERVIRFCAARPTTWINQQIIDGYTALHRLGHAHSVEAWAEGELVGGLYGVQLGGAFFGESMFSTQPHASKIVLVHLAARLRVGGFQLFDTQFMTPHLRQFGAKEITTDHFMEKLEIAKKIPADFFAAGDYFSGLRSLQEIGHIS